MPSVKVRIQVSAAEFMKYYRGHAEYVKTTTTTGQTVSFPARILRQFMSHSGIVGEFLITFDRHGKFESISKIS